MKELIFGIIGGTALLMYGIQMMGSGLEKVSGEAMKKFMSAMAGNVFKATLAGIIITALVQSSTAVTVLAVGFVNAGLLEFAQAIGIIYGANIGTTVTAQIMAVSYNFSITDYALPIIGVGFGLYYFCKGEKWKNLGRAIMGFGLMFFGLKVLNEGAPFLQNSPAVEAFFEHYASIPIVGLLLGIIITAAVHSSAAIVALVMVLSSTGLIDFVTAVYIILGSNIGTSISALLASAGGNVNAKRTAVAHLVFNMGGVALIYFFIPQFAHLIERLTYATRPNVSLDALIANTHTVFNVGAALLFLPFTKLLVKFITKVVPDKSNGWVDDDDSKVMDQLLLNTPAAAVKAAKKAISFSTLRSKVMLDKTVDYIIRQDPSNIEEIMQNEKNINAMQKNLTHYTVDLSKSSLAGVHHTVIPALITCMNHIERTGDHCKDLLAIGKVRVERNLNFSDTALNDLNNITGLVMEMYDLMENILLGKESQNEDFEKLSKLEDDIDIKAKQLVDGHVERLEQGNCTIEAGVYFMDIVNMIERISDHIYKAARDLRAGEMGIVREEK